MNLVFTLLLKKLADFSFEDVLTHTCTSMCCLECGGQCYIPHPGLPAKRGAALVHETVLKANDRAINYMPSQEAISRGGDQLTTVQTWLAPWDQPGL